MKKTFLMTLCISIIGLTIISCKKKEDPGPTTTVMSQPPMNGSDTLGQGIFTGYSDNLSGSALLYKEGMPSVKKLRFANFNMDQGPDVHVFLSKKSTYSAGSTIEIGSLSTGYNNSSITYDITAANYTSDYKYVLVYCVQYNALFGYTELK